MRDTRWLTALAGLLLPTLVGCFGSSEDTSPTDTTPTDTAGLVCADLGTDECETLGADQCRSLDGRPLQDDGAGGQCVDFSVDGVAMGCVQQDQGCGDAETLAAPAEDPDSCTHWFPSTCLPAGYVACGSTVDECAS